MSVDSRWVFFFLFKISTVRLVRSDDYIHIYRSRRTGRGRKFHHTTEVGASFRIKRERERIACVFINGGAIISAGRAVARRASLEASLCGRPTLLYAAAAAAGPNVDVSWRGFPLGRGHQVYCHLARGTMLLPLPSFMEQRRIFNGFELTSRVTSETTTERRPKQRERDCPVRLSWSRTFRSPTRRRLDSRTETLTLTWKKAYVCVCFSIFSFIF